MNRLNTKLSHSNILRLLLIAILVICIVLLVQLTGGAPNAYLHLLYIPIFLSAHYWGIRGGVSVAVVGGILASPLIPLYIASERIMQSSNNHIIRLTILILVGLIAGYTFKKVDKLNKEIENNCFINPFTGTYNTNKLIKDLYERINNGEKFVIVSIKLTNIDQVSKYIEQQLAIDILNKLVSELSNVYGKDAVYTLGYDEINFVTSLNCSYLEECRCIIERYSTTFKINQYTFRIFMNVGVYEYYGTNETPIDIYNKVRIAYEQGHHLEMGIYFYDKEFDLNRKEFIEISASLLDAINNNELYLVYQPMINISDNTITGVEVLIRWDRKEKKPVGPNVFIKIAEDIGFIKEISKFVLDNSFHQILDWNKKGIVLNFSINFTINELLENHFMEWEKRVTENEHIIKSKLEIEITERVLSQNNDKIVKRINELRAKGIKISIDDFGTGFNSLMRVTQFPYDQIKIDKYFINRIDDFEIREYVRDTIHHAHKFERKVVAEGVETQEQYNLLREIDCDIIQGYYYSKPLSPDEFEQYYFEFLKLASPKGEGIRM